MAKEDRPTLAFLLSLISGIFIIMGGLTTTAMMGLFWWMGHHWGAGIWRWGWMGGHMAGIFSSGIFLGLGLFGIVCGIAVLIGALMLNRDPKGHAKWGALVLAFSILSIVGAMGGWLVGLVLGVLGGALAISWEPKGAPSP